MKLKEYILEEQKDNIEQFLIENGFSNFWNKYCPMSRFYTKDIKNNKTIYVRKDLDTKYNHYVYKFEVWVRDNNKDILDKKLDSMNMTFKYNSKIEIFKDYINYLINEMEVL